MSLKEFLEYPILSIHTYTLHMYQVIAAVVVIGVAYIVEKISKKIFYRRSSQIDKGTRYALHQIVYYGIIIVTFIIVMRIMGVNISPFLVGSSAVLVGIGLGLQNLFLDFISGVIILLDKSVRVGDILDMNGVMGRVEQISMRTTKILTTDRKTIVFPNSYLTKDKLTNYSSHDAANAFFIDIGVDYKTDMKTVETLLVEAAKENPDISKEREPYIRLNDFADSSLNLRLYFFSDDPFHISHTKSEIRKSILEKFRANNIIIPFPTTTIDFPAYK
jgi:putative efflux protein